MQRGALHLFVSQVDDARLGANDLSRESDHLLAILPYPQHALDDLRKHRRDDLGIDVKQRFRGGRVPMFDRAVDGRLDGVLRGLDARQQVAQNLILSKGGGQDGAVVHRLLRDRLLVDVRQ